MGTFNFKNINRDTKYYEGEISFIYEKETDSMFDLYLFYRKEFNNFLFKVEKINGYYNGVQFILSPRWDDILYTMEVCKDEKVNFFKESYVMEALKELKEFLKLLKRFKFKEFIDCDWVGTTSQDIKINDVFKRMIKIIKEG
ncbi:MAG: hypothetical protein LBC92_05860 [Rickettsiales bacterium]|jgi:hypothetical protein|nr:hypothetical protein [Rickettsiales bacterium]